MSAKACTLELVFSALHQLHCHNSIIVSYLLSLVSSDPLFLSLPFPPKPFRLRDILKLFVLCHLVLLLL